MTGPAGKSLKPASVLILGSGPVVIGQAAQTSPTLSAFNGF